jgi:hypothetical protein
MGETTEMGRGGYYFSENAYHGDPFALKPRPTIGTVALTGNTTPVERFFEALDAASSKYVYALAGAKSFKVKLSDRTLAETKTFTVTPYFASGTYTGDGGATKAITGVGFQPCAVIVKGEGATAAVIRTADMPANTSKAFPATASSTDGVRVLDADGFTVGNGATVNTNGVKYYWQAWKAGTRIKAGTYAGSGAVQTIAGVGFPSKVILVCQLGAIGIGVRLDTLEGDDTRLPGTGAKETGAITAFTDDGFTVGTSWAANQAATTYYYLAIGTFPGLIITGSYTGDGASTQKIPGLPLTPTYAIVMGLNTYAVQRSSSISGDSSQVFAAVANASDCVESLNDDGFTVGSDSKVNLSGAAFHYIAFAPATGTPTCGKPALWAGIRIVPLGNLAEVQRLSTVAIAPTADTWEAIVGFGAEQLCVKGNKIAKAVNNRYVSLCSADNLVIAGNWGAEYPVGPPDCVITDLVEWSDELAVCATDGMYMFDGVATSKQQLPLLGGLKDDDNGKNTLGMASFIFYPSADGFWRWQYGAHKRVDPDADRYYVKAKETTNEPLNLKHYGSAFCGDHVYHACYDGTNYLLMHGKLTEEGELVWDCLLSTTNAIKAVYLDSNRYLWFGYGNNLAYIVLSQGGEADGGTFGNASLVTNIYEREIILAEDAEVRLRMIKIITRNMPADGTWSWDIYASLDGAAFAMIGAAVTADGVNKRYFTAADNLTAKRIRLKYIGVAGATFTPDTTPPEIIFAGVYGEAKPDDAETVKAIINLDDTKGSRAGVTIYDELKARENAGVVQVRHPIKGTMLNMILYGVGLANLRQKGYEEPVAVAEVYMRRGDTS